MAGDGERLNRTWVGVGGGTAGGPGGARATLSTSGRIPMNIIDWRRSRRRRPRTPNGMFRMGADNKRDIAAGLAAGLAASAVQCERHVEFRF